MQDQRPSSEKEKGSSMTDKASVSVHQLESGIPEETVPEEERDVFRTDVGTEGPDLRGLSWLGAAALIAKSQFGLGVLGLPKTFDVLGLVPGLISLVTLCAIATVTGVYVGKFRLRHPQVHSIGDAAALMFGRFGLEFAGGATWLFYTLCYGAALLTVSIAFNTLTDHAACTMVWIGMGAAVSLVLGLVTRTMKVLSWCGYVAVLSVFLGVWVTAIACLAQDRPAAAPLGMPVDKKISAFTTSSFSSACSAVATQLLSLAGTASFFTIHAEMRDQRKYARALYTGQAMVVFNYIAISCIMYGKVGQFIASPALGSAGAVFKKVGYGISLPALFFSCFFQAHIAGKYALVRILRGTRHLQSNTPWHWVVWSSMMAIIIAVGMVVASAIPFFGDLLGLIGALLGTIFTMILPGFMCLYEMSHVDKRENPVEKGSLPESSTRRHWLVQVITSRQANRRGMLTVWPSILVVVAGLFIGVTGTYGSIKSISDAFASGQVGSAFSCADNSGK
ncbi:hypothetical protein IE53DRAFT_384405 [Violaceomyces palustris]|uniref:Uncharacterized protein n=1 Tax=Violaceomyces palustris TaxID=1673888 RepID=A0ACD0P509_9BASI|nr:hypothetical protein IE53DRAFT_384405 [Violaceomyces palustris]